MPAAARRGSSRRSQAPPPGERQNTKAAAAPASPAPAAKLAPWEMDSAGAAPVAAAREPATPATPKAKARKRSVAAAAKADGAPSAVAAARPRKSREERGGSVAPKKGQEGASAANAVNAVPGASPPPSPAPAATPTPAPATPTKPRIPKKKAKGASAAKASAKEAEVSEAPKSLPAAVTSASAPDADSCALDDEAGEAVGKQTSAGRSAPVGTPENVPDTSVADLRNPRARQTQEERAAEAVQKSKSLLSEYRALEAEAVLREAGLPTTSTDPLLSRLLGMYDEIAACALKPDDAKDSWMRVYSSGEKRGHKSYLDYKPDPTSHALLIRVMIEIPARMDACILPADQVDFWPDWNTAIARKPVEMGAQTRLHKMVHGFWQLPAGVAKWDAIAELHRFPNHKLGFLAEHVATPKECHDLPACPKGYTRMHTRTYNIWMPAVAADGSDFTILVQVNRLTPPRKISAWILRMFLRILAPSLIRQFIDSAALASRSGSKWRKRLQEDPDGLFAELRKLVETARRRPLRTSSGEVVSLDRLPSHEMFASS